MTQQIRGKAVCLFSHLGKILVVSERDKVKNDVFACPVGGGIEFGEHSEETVRREVHEELGLDVIDLRLIGVLENIFVCNGQPGHEIVFVYDGAFTDPSLYGRDVIHGHEHGISQDFTAEWRVPDELSSQDIRLVPDGLADLLARSASNGP